MGWNRNRIARAAALSAAMTMVVASPELAGASDTEATDAVQIEADAEVEASAEVEVEDEIEAEAETESHAEAGAEVETDAHVETETETETEAGADVEAEVEHEAEADAGAEVEHEADVEADADIESESETDAEVDVEHEAGIEVDADVEAGADASIWVSETTSTSFTVSSSKAISNVVVVYGNGEHHKIDGLSGTSWTFHGEVAAVAGVYVKSGDNGSDAGPGYGQWLTVIAGADTGTEGEGGTDDDVEAPMPGVGADVRVDAVDCDSFMVLSSKDISNVVIVYADGREDLKEDGLSGTEWTFTGDVTEVEGVFVKSGDNHSGEGPGYGEWRDVEVTADCVVDTGAEIDAEVEVQVDNDTQVGGEADVDADTDTDTDIEVGGEVEAETGADADVRGESEVRGDASDVAPTPSGLAASNATGTEVLGDVTTRPYANAGMSSGSTLPRTGADSKALLPLGGALVLGGIALDLLSRRRQAAANDVR